MEKDINLDHPSLEEHGDYASSVALKIGKQLNQKPLEIASKLVDQLSKTQDAPWEKIEAADPGFINFHLKLEDLKNEIEKVSKEKEDYGAVRTLQDKKIMVEYAHPNTHKEMHIGHMRTLITGEALARIFSFCGATVFRANYQGDIGPHVAKAIFGTQKILGEQKMSLDQADKLSLKEKAHLLGEGYIRGNQEYESSKEKIDDINSQLYKKSAEVWKFYETTRKWSLDYYDMFYIRFGTKFDRLYFESEVADPGKKLVLKNVGRVFEKSDGAIIFDGEKFSLHKRVFVTSDGNPTYEGKEMALGLLEYLDFPFDQCVHVVASEQAGYFQVVIKALEQLDQKFAGRQYHLSMGMVQLVGKKISSRTGVLITVDGLLDDVKQLLRPKLHSQNLTTKELDHILEVATIGAVKYSVLKTGPLLNAVFDLEKSVSLDGDSGPYLQYTYARAKSVLRKSESLSSHSGEHALGEATPESLENKPRDAELGQHDKLYGEELSLLRYLYRFPEVVEAAARTYSPNLVCTYSFELAKRFNNFYNNTPILKADTAESVGFRVSLTQAVSIVLKNGLNLLGIEALEVM